MERAPNEDSGPFSDCGTHKPAGCCTEDKQIAYRDAGYGAGKEKHISECLVVLDGDGAAMSVAELWGEGWSPQNLLLLVLSANYFDYNFQAIRDLFFPKKSVDAIRNKYESYRLKTDLQIHDLIIRNLLPKNFFNEPVIVLLYMASFVDQFEREICEYRNAHKQKNDALQQTSFFYFEHNSFHSMCDISTISPTNQQDVQQLSERGSVDAAI